MKDISNYKFGGGSKRNISIDIIFIFLVIFTYLVLPKSFYTDITGLAGVTDSQLLVPWHFQRFALTLVSCVYIATRLLTIRFSPREVIVVTLCCIFIIINLAEGIYSAAYGLVASLAGYILFKRYVAGFVLLDKKVYWLLNISSIIYIGQYAIYRDHGRLVSSFTDPNISGYYLFLIYCWFRHRHLRFLCLVALIAGIGSVSRNLIFCVFLFEIVLKARWLIPILKYRLRRSAQLFTTISLVVVLSFTWLYTSKIAENISKVAENTGSYSRVVTLKDESNVTRFEANKHFLLSLFSGRMILSGYGSGRDGSSYNVPHNAFFRSIYRFGLFYALGLWILFFKVFNFFYLHGSLMLRAFLLTLFLYYSFLGDFITGLELILLVIFCISWGEYHGGYRKR